MSNYTFNTVPKTNIQRSRFDCKSSYKTTGDASYLIPIKCLEILPNDSWVCNATALVRETTKITPTLDSEDVRLEAFFVPSRLVWKHWVNFQGEQNYPNESIDYLTPTLSGTFTTGTVGDYFGIPTNTTSDITVNSLPFRAYHLIYDQWYRDQNLQSSTLSSESAFGDGPDDFTKMNTLHKRCKAPSYFNSCLPFPQFGEGVKLPLGGTAPVSLDSFPSTYRPILQLEDPNGYWHNITRDGNNDSPIYIKDSMAKQVDQPTLVADLSEATAATINSLRLAFATQRYLEALARGGHRYCESLKSIWHCDAGDARLQRCEYLGGISVPVNTTIVPQSSNTNSTSPQGNLAAYSHCLANKGWSKSFTEHGYVIVLASVMAQNTYQQGLHRMWSRRTALDYALPQFAHIGEQAVLNKEIYCDGTSDDDKVFGYMPRYDEYRYQPNMVTGKMRSNTVGGSLDFWHYATYFENRPSLNSDFITDNSDETISRSLALSSEPQFLFDIFFDEKLTRALPLNGTPGMLDHF